MSMDLTQLSKGSLERLKRIQELKKCNELDALEYAISVGWHTIETRMYRDMKAKLAISEVDSGNSSK